MTRVIVVGSHDSVSGDICRSLKDGGFEVAVAGSVRQVEELWERDRDRATVLVVVASGHRGGHVSLCRRLRARTDTPLVVIGCEDDTEEAVVALDAGADDYLVWPVHPRLMVARLDAVLRRERRCAMSHAVVSLGDLKLDLMRRQVVVGDRQASLTPAEYRLLMCLMRNYGQVVSHRVLVKYVLGFDCEEREAQETMKVYVRRLRHKIEADPHVPSHVHSVRGFGYVLETRSVAQV